MSNLPEIMAAKYKIRDALSPRNYLFTFNENGFYKVLKRRIFDELKTINTINLRKLTMHYVDILFVSTIISSILAAILGSYMIGVFAGVIQTLTIIAAHNFFHQRDNWRMGLFNLTFMNYK